MSKTMGLALLLACGAAQASEWKPIPSEKYPTYVDTSTITVSGQIWRASFKVLYKPHEMSVPDLTKPDRWIAKDVGVDEFDCSRETIRVISGAMYHNGDDMPTDGDNSITTMPPTHVAPGTIEYPVMKFVCSWKPA